MGAPIIAWQTRQKTSVPSVSAVPISAEVTV